VRGIARLAEEMSASQGRQLHIVISGDGVPMQNVFDPQL